MKTYQLPDGSVVVPGQAFTLSNGEKFPSNWIASASDADLAQHGIAVIVVADPPPPAPMVSALQFRQLFTSAERLAITQAAMANAQIREFMDDESAAGDVHLNDPEVIGGIAALVAASLLTQDRANQVLSGQAPGTPGMPA